MKLLNEIMSYNNTFVESKAYEEFLTDKYPDKRMVILTCMDTRLTELLPKAMNLRNGDAKMIKSAGAVVSHPFGSVMRSIMVAVYELGANEVLVVGHRECGMTGMNANSVLEKAKASGVTEDLVNLLTHSGIDLKRWLSGFDQVETGVVESVHMIRNHPLMPKTVPVHGLIIDPETGKLEIIVNGYEELA